MPRPEVFNREDVIKKVQAVFWAKGYNGTSMQDLVDATGLNRSSIYNSFGSKHQLFMLSLKNYQDGNINHIEALSEHAESPMHLLRGLFNQAVAASCSDQNNGCMIVNCATELANQEPEVMNYVGRSNEKMQRKFQELLAAAKDADEIAPESDTHVVAHFLLMNLQGLRVNGLTNRDPKLLAALVDQIFKNI